jgi:ferrous iron transport protein B
MGLTPKTQVTLVKRAPMGDPVEIELRGYSLTLRVADAAEIQITPLAPLTGETTNG